MAMSGSGCMICLTFRTTPGRYHCHRHHLKCDSEDILSFLGSAVGVLTTTLSKAISHWADSEAGLQRRSEWRCRVVDVINAERRGDEEAQVAATPTPTPGEDPSRQRQGSFIITPRALLAPRRIFQPVWCWWSVVRVRCLLNL